MTTFVSTFVESLVIQEIDRIVAEAAAGRSTLSTSAAITQITKAYPNSPVPESDIAKRLIVAALAAGVALEMGKEHTEQEQQGSTSNPSESGANRV